ncbi:hypothetical protein CSA37_11550 [Candidatus Fermentibacteria bacterium]|nr:MAG: hypothetical protein CSA37_11550 [Candidatus Fermentibacteria bacterium]
MRPVLMAYALILSIVTCFGCSKEPVSTGEMQVRITVSDTIGVEHGDSNYVFGAIVDASFFPDGRIAVLDVLKNRISLFDRSGEFIGSFGRAGNGPGEFAEPASFALSANSGYAVADNMHGTILFYDSTFSFTRELRGFSNSPYSIRNGSGNSIVGMQFDYKMEGTCLYLGTRIGAWTDGTEPETVINSEYVIHDDNREGFLPTFSFDTSLNGDIVSALHSETVFQAVAQTCNGDTLFVINEPWNKRLKTGEELASEHMCYRFDTPGFSEADRRAVTDAWEPKIFSNAISGVRIDSNDRVWLKTNIPDNPSPVFRIYDMTGHFVGEAVTDLGAAANNWTFVFHDSLALAFDSNTDEYPVLYLLDVSFQ